MTDKFIEQLVNDLKPAKTLANSKLWLHCGLCMMVMIAVVLASMGLRPDYKTALQNGALLWKPAIFLLIWAGSLFLITDISRPNGGFKKWHYIPILLAFTIFGWQIFSQVTSSTWHQMMKGIGEKSSLYCLMTILVGGIIDIALIWIYWLKRTASYHPSILGALSGVSAGCLAAAAYSIHCTNDMMPYIAIYYGLSIFALTLVGGLLGRILLKW